MRNGAGIFKYKSTQQYPLHPMIEMKFILATLIYHCHTGRPVPCIAHTADKPYDGMVIQRRSRYSRAYSITLVSTRTIIFFTSLMYREAIRASKEAEKPV